MQNFIVDGIGSDEVRQQSVSIGRRYMSALETIILIEKSLRTAPYPAMHIQIQC